MSDTKDYASIKRRFDAEFEAGGIDGVAYRAERWLREKDIECWYKLRADHLRWYSFVFLSFTAIVGWVSAVVCAATYDDPSVELKKANEKTQAYRIMLMEHKIDPETGKQWK